MGSKPEAGNSKEQIENQPRFQLLQKPHNAGSRREARFFNPLFSVGV